MTPPSYLASLVAEQASVSTVAATELQGSGSLEQVPHAELVGVSITFITGVT